ncbi:hypothetical protein OSB04_024405 [Centaurea solstitialis]|uniref:Integrase catalytic domain-containing protein n=1 Tax=Centaurea solstitialis TaxID=347529 RepID=A0AA38STJ4_9ASTR|nr:hypothetical protein OSB04_024405 [Centaurea solstitialis]
MSKEIISTGSETRPPVLVVGEYQQWKRRMINFLDLLDDKLMVSITKGRIRPTVTVAEVARTEVTPYLPAYEVEKPYDMFSHEQRARAAIDKRALTLLTMALPNDMFARVDSCKDARSMWLGIEQQIQGGDKALEDSDKDLSLWKVSLAKAGTSLEKIFKGTIRGDQTTINNVIVLGTTIKDLIKIVDKVTTTTNNSKGIRITTPTTTTETEDIRETLLTLRKKAAIMKKKELGKVLMADEEDGVMEPEDSDDEGPSAVQGHCLMADFEEPCISGSPNDSTEEEAEGGYMCCGIARKSNEGRKLAVASSSVSSELQGYEQACIKTPCQGLPETRLSKDTHCSACEKSSHPPKMVTNCHRPLDMLHMDLCGPMRVESLARKKYMLVLIDEYSRYTWVQFLRAKSDAADLIIAFIKQIQVLLGRQVKKLRSDNGT